MTKITEDLLQTRMPGFRISTEINQWTTRNQQWVSNIKRHDQFSYMYALLR